MFDFQGKIQKAKNGVTKVAPGCPVCQPAAIDRAVREAPEKLIIHLKGHKETLPVSWQYYHLFKQD